MTFLAKTLVIGLVGCLLGLLLTNVLVARGPLFGAVQAGPWRSFPRSGDAADPYARAAYARSAEIPLGSGEGLTFIAGSADDGATLRRHCTYVLRGGTMPARAWTLTVVTRSGDPDAGAPLRNSFTSSEILRTIDGRFAIAVGPEVRAGNWLPVSGATESTAFALMLRLYDTVLSTAGAPDAGLLPSLTREGCA